MSFFVFFPVLINFDVNVLDKSDNTNGQSGLNLAQATRIGITDTPADHDPIPLPGLIVLPGESTQPSTSTQKSTTSDIDSSTTTPMWSIELKQSSSPGDNLGLVIGIVVGAVLVILFSIAFLFWFLHRQKKANTTRKKRKSQEPSGETSFTLSSASSSSSTSKTKSTMSAASLRGVKQTPSRSRSRSKRGSRRLSSVPKNNRRTISAINRGENPKNSAIYDQMVLYDSTMSMSMIKNSYEDINDPLNKAKGDYEQIDEKLDDSGNVYDDVNDKLENEGEQYGRVRNESDVPTYDQVGKKLDY